jgi:hypothetical protein
MHGYQLLEKLRREALIIANSGGSATRRIFANPLNTHKFSEILELIVFVLKR